MAKASRHGLSGGEIQQFLRSFEGAAASFDRADERWTLWLPEMTPGDHPLTPASQVFFPVILRNGPQAIAIRFLYDCTSGKVRYYTSAIPTQISGLPEFENAVSELFRHSLPVEPMRERKLGRGVPPREVKILEPRPGLSMLSDPEPVSAPAVIPAVPLTEPEPIVIPAGGNPPVVRRSVRVEVGPRVRAVLMAFIITTGLVVMTGLGIFAWLQATQDPGVLHHRMMLEEMRLQRGK